MAITIQLNKYIVQYNSLPTAYSEQHLPDCNETRQVEMNHLFSI